MKFLKCHRPMVVALSTEHKSPSQPSMLLLLLFTIPSVISSATPTSAVAQSRPASALSFSLDADRPQAITVRRTSIKTIVFFTNRQVDEGASLKAREGKKLLATEDVFLNRPGQPMTLGVAEISYPTNRSRGQADYSENSFIQNPLRQFSIVAYSTFSSVEEFKSFFKRESGNPQQRSLIFVHGMDNSFNNAAERMAQLAIDLRRDNVPVLFSWPSDAERAVPTSSSAWTTVSSYRKLKNISRASTQYLSAAVELITDAMGNRPDMLSHSMGTDLTVEAIVGSYNRADSKVPGAAALKLSTLILAAPDISKRGFETLTKPAVLASTRQLVIYCSSDRVLEISKVYNNGDERLGYCDAAPAIPGVDVVSVKGLNDFARHSYYLSYPRVLDDIEVALGAILGDSSQAPPGRSRELKVP